MNPIHKGIFILTLVGCMISLINPLRYILLGEICTAIITSHESRTSELFYQGEYINPEGDLIPFEYKQGSLLFGSPKEVGQVFQVYCFTGKTRSIAEADYFTLFRYALTLLSVSLLIIYLNFKKKTESSK